MKFLKIKMYLLNKMFVGILMTLLAVAYCKEQLVAITEIENNVVEANPAEIAVLTQLKVTKSDSGSAIYTYKCTVGTYRSNRLACTASDSTSWPSAHNVELKLRCPKSGSGLTLSYVEVVYSVSSPSVNCIVNEGAIGLGYIGLTVSAWNTLVFSYSASFYTY